MRSVCDIPYKEGLMLDLYMPDEGAFDLFIWFHGGGLKDTIKDSGDGEGNGFTFATYNAHDMLEAVWRALAAYFDSDGWNTLVLRAMNCDNSWKRSAGECLKIYKDIVK